MSRAAGAGFFPSSKAPHMPAASFSMALPNSPSGAERLAQRHHAVQRKIIVGEAGVHRAVEQFLQIRGARYRRAAPPGSPALQNVPWESRCASIMVMALRVRCRLGSSEVVTR